MKNRYNATIRAAYLGYVVQAIVSYFAPLLFVQLRHEFNIPLSKITQLIGAGLRLTGKHEVR